MEESSSSSCNQKHSSAPPQQHKLFLDTMGTCFLCLHENENNRSTGESSVVGLRNICRYLNISSSSITSGRLNRGPVSEDGNDGGQQQGNKQDFSVTLCPSCASLTTKLSEMIAELELLKMLVNDKLKQFYGILNHSDQEELEQESCVQLTKLKDKLRSKFEDPVNFRLVEDLRQEAKVKCAIKVKSADASSKPTVLLRRLQPKPKTNIPIKCEQLIMEPPCDPFEENGANFVIEADDAINETPENLDSSLVDEPSVQMTVDIKMETPIPVDLEIPDAPATNPEEATTTPPVPSVQSIPAQVITNSYSSAEVRQFISETFLKNYDKVPMNSPNIKMRNRCICLVCNADSPWQLIRQHIVRNHLQVLFEHKRPHHWSEENFTECCVRMIATQTAPAIRLMTTAKKTGKVAVLCPYCGVQCNDEPFLRFHLVTEHYHILEEKLVVIIQEVIQVDNVVKYTVKEEPSSDMEDDPVEYILDTDLAAEMVETPMETDALLNKTVVTEKRTETISLSRACSSMPTTSVPSNDVNWSSFYEFIPDYRGRNSYLPKCLLCSSIEARATTRRHLVNQHPEKLFASKRLANVSEEEFKTKCSQLLRQFTDQGGTATREECSLHPDFLCSICKIECKNHFQLKCHLIEAHYGILGEKLLSLQQAMIGQGSVGGKETGKVKRKWIVCSPEDGGCGQKYLTNFGLKRHKSRDCPMKRNGMS